MLRGDPVTDPRQHICDGVGHRHVCLPPLPAALGHAGDLTLQRELAETDAAQREVADVAARPAAELAAVALPYLKLVRTVGANDHRNLGHRFSPYTRFSKGIPSSSKRRL